MQIVKYVVVLSCLWLAACTSELPSIDAVKRVQLSNELVLQGKLSKDGKSSYLLSKGPVFSQWQNQSQEPVLQINAQNLLPNTRRFTLSQDEKRLLTADARTVLLWQLPEAAVLGSLDLTSHLGDASITSMLFISNNYFVIGASDGTLLFADINNNLFRRNGSHDGEVVHLQLTQNKDYLLSGGNDGQVIMTDLGTLLVRSKFELPFRITSLQLSANNQWVFVSDALNQNFIWDPWRNKKILELDYWQQYKWFRHSRFIAGNRYLLTTSPKTELSLWDMQTGKETAMWQAESQGFGSTVNDLVVLDNQLLTLSSDAVLQWWDLAPLLTN